MDPHELDVDKYDPFPHRDPIHPDLLAFNAERARQKHLILRRRRIRDFCDPFDVTYETFVKSYRLSQDLVFTLVDIIRPYVPRTSSAVALPLEKKVLAVLSFYATGSYQTPTGKNFEVCVAQPTMSTYIEEVSTALNAPEIVTRLIRFAATAEEVDFCVERNRMLGAQINNTIAYTDGSLIKIRKPSVTNNRLAFMGRKGFASVNVQFTCDRRLYVNNVLARFAGSTNSFVYNASALRRRMIELQAVRRCHLLGDSGYPAEPWMITPFAREEAPEEDTPESRFNKVHSSDRNCVERCIGTLKQVFRAINDERVLHYDAVKACRIIVAMVVVHNLRILAQVPVFHDLGNLRNENVHDGDEPEDDEEDDDVLALLTRGRAARRQIFKELEAARDRGHRL